MCNPGEQPPSRTESSKGTPGGDQGGGDLENKRVWRGKEKKVKKEEVSVQSCKVQ